MKTTAQIYELFIENDKNNNQKDNIFQKWYSEEEIADFQTHIFNCINDNINNPDLKYLIEEYFFEFINKE
jgi:ribonucleotide reductase beta subunit family protein with ferritin-like domain